MSGKYKVVGYILAPAGAASGGGCCSTILGLSVLTVIGLACYIVFVLYAAIVSPIEKAKYDKLQATRMTKHSEIVNNPKSYLKITQKEGINNLEVFEVTNLTELPIFLKVSGLRSFNPPRIHGCATERLNMTTGYSLGSGESVDLYCYLWHNTTIDCIDTSVWNNKCDLIVFQYDNPDYPPGYLKLP